MNKKVTLVILMLFFVLSTAGCTKILKNDDNKVVKNKITGQNLVENILCQPEDEETIKMYIENNIDINSLPKCNKLSVTEGEYEGIWTTIFVKPLAWLIIKIGDVFKNYGIAVIITTILIRLIMYPFTKKTALQSENMKKAKPELEKLENKYKNNDSQEAKMQKTQEMLLIYKKYNISPLSGCLFGFIQIPLFFAFYEALNRLPAIFEENMLGFQLGTSPITALSNGKYYYLIFVVLVIAATYFSFKMNSADSMSLDQQKQMKTMTKMSTILISIMSFSISTGIALYWIFNSSFTIMQNLIVKRRKKNDSII